MISITRVLVCMYFYGSRPTLGRVSFTSLSNTQYKQREASDCRRHGPWLSIWIHWKCVHQNVVFMQPWPIIRPMGRVSSTIRILKSRSTQFALTNPVIILLLRCVWICTGTSPEGVLLPQTTLKTDRALRVGADPHPTQNDDYHQQVKGIYPPQKSCSYVGGRITLVYWSWMYVSDLIR